MSNESARDKTIRLIVNLSGHAIHVGAAAYGKEKTAEKRMEAAERSLFIFIMGRRPDAIEKKWLIDGERPKGKPEGSLEKKAKHHERRVHSTDDQQASPAAH